MDSGYSDFFAVSLFLATSFGLLSTLLLPSWWARRWAHGLGSYVTFVLGLQTLWAVAWVLWFTIQSGEPWRKLFVGAEGGLIEFGISLDGAASMQLALVSLIGWAICRYSIRYLEGEASQGRFFQWTSLTLCSVSWMVVSPNLMQFLIAWALTSVGLHQLLLFYPDRPLAQRAAWTNLSSAG